MHSKYSYSDLILVRKLKKDNKKAFELIFGKYKEKLYFFALSYLNSATETDEIIQVVFISLWEHRHSINETLSLKNYLYKSTINTIYNYFKHKAIRQKYLDYSMAYEIKEDNYTQESINLNDLKRSLDSLIERLPDSQQKIFKMSRWEGLSHIEIANRLGLSIRSVENQVYRAMRFIKENLKEEFYF